MSSTIGLDEHPSAVRTSKDGSLASVIHEKECYSTHAVGLHGYLLQPLRGLLERRRLSSCCFLHKLQFWLHFFGCGSGLLFTVFYLLCQTPGILVCATADGCYFTKSISLVKQCLNDCHPICLHVSSCKKEVGIGVEPIRPGL